jgi:DNA-binding transcriptional MocR family regulator
VPTAAPTATPTAATNAASAAGRNAATTAAAGAGRSVDSDVDATTPASVRPGSFLAAGGGRTLVEQIVDWYAARIDERTLRPGARMPSIRGFSAGHRVSRFTVVEAYDRLIARGYLESRPGSGFFVRERNLAAGLAQARAWADSPNPQMDVVWLLRNMFRQLPPRDMPGGGVLPGDWLDAELVGASLRALGRQHGASMLAYGQAQGYLPLRQQLQLKLMEHEIAAQPDQIVTTCGVTQGLDLVAQHLVKPGDTILVDDPGWFLMFGRFSLLGARVIGVPRLADGPDLDRLRTLCELHRPRMYVLSSVLHNPTGTSISAAKAFQVLRIAEAHDLTIVEDDVYCDLHPGPAAQPCTRLASLDRLERVVYLGGFSKTLAANLRVGFIACSPGLARALTDLKMLVGLTSSELGERVVFRVLSEGHYRRHLDRLRDRLARARDPMLRTLERLGLAPFAGSGAGMFAWMDTGQDSGPLAEVMLGQGFLMAPGSLFSPEQRASGWMRFNLATSGNPKMLAALAEALAGGRQRLKIAEAPR